MMRPLRMMFIAATLVMSSCKRDLPTETTSAVVLAAERAAYAAGDTAVFTMSNATATPLYLPSCCSQAIVILQVNKAGTWIDTLAVGEPCLMMCPSALLKVNTKQVYADRMPLKWIGTFRLKMYYGWSQESFRTDSVLSREISVQ